MLLAQDGYFAIHGCTQTPATASTTVEKAKSMAIVLEALQSGETQGALQIDVPAPVLWNAESPALYRLILSCGGEYIPEYVGIRQIGIIDEVIYINGQKVKFRGVNRHALPGAG